MEMKQRDPVVVKAITNVTSRQPVEELMGLPRYGRIQAIYDEIRRLDRVRVTKTIEPTNGRTSRPD